MSRPESEHEITAICVKNLFSNANSDKKCQCPRCTGRGNRKTLKKEIEFKELLKNIGGGENEGEQV